MPHRPLDDCLCRKPKPGLILQAAALRLDLPGSILIGDTWNDILASAGVGRAILVRAGLGAAQAEASPPTGTSNLAANSRALPEAIHRFVVRD